MMDIKVFQEKLEQILAQAASQDKTLSGGDIRENICGCRASGWM